MRRFTHTLIAATAAAWLTGAALAQSEAEETTAQVTTSRNQEIQFSVSGKYEQLFETDLDRGGEVDISRFAFGLRASTELSDTVRMALAGRFTADSYDFSGETVFGPDPWEDIYTLDFAAIFTVQTDTPWTIFGGPLLRFSRESGADWDDGVSAGGSVGASYKFNDTLTLGGGVGIVSQIEDDPQFFPLVVVDWRIKDDWRLTTQAAPSAGGGGGLELIYSGYEDWEFGLGGAARFDRFRLDDEGPTPDGVGESSTYFAKLRATYTGADNITISAWGGMALGGELDLSDDDGHLIVSEDVDPGVVVGVSLGVRF